MKKVWIWVLSIVALLVVLLLSGAWYLSKNWKGLIEEKLAVFVKESSQGLYTISYDALDINPALGNVTFRNLALHADTAVYRLLEEQQKAKNDVFEVELKSLRIKRFSLFDLLKNKGLHVASIAIDGVDMHWMQKHHAYNDTIVDTNKESFEERLHKVFSFVKVDAISIDTVAFNFVKRDESGKELNKFSHKANSIQVQDIMIDSLSKADPDRIFYTKKIAVTIPEFKHILSNGFYKAGFKSLRLNTEDKSVVLIKGYYQPIIPRHAYFNQKGENKALMNIEMDSLRLDGIDFKSLLEKQDLTARHVMLSQGHVQVYGDKRYPKKPENQIGQAPHQKIMRLPFKMHLDSVRVDRVDVQYTEMGDRYQREGTITFDRTSGYLTNVTNDTTVLAKNKYMRADLLSHVMNSGELKVLFNFDMLSKAGDYTYVGGVGRMRAPAFNRILQPLLNVEIASGNIKRIHFDMKGTDRRTTGSFLFDYDDLKVKLPDIERNNGKKVSGKIVSFFVNQILINDSNPDANEIYHKGSVDYPRDPSFTFFKNLWKSLLEGIKQTAGISKEREQKLMGKAESAKNIAAETKEVAGKAKGFFNKIFKKKDKAADE